MAVTIGDLAWSRDGKHLYAKKVNGALIVADVQSQGGEFHAGVLRQIFSPPGLSAFDTARPTAGYLAAVPVDETLALPISLVLDWGSELKK
jgi:hypothetical protein